MIIEVKRGNTIVEAQIDEEMFDLVNESTWYYNCTSKTTLYVMTNYCKTLGTTGKERKKTTYLHKLVYEAKYGKSEGKLELDFIDGNTLNCTLSNLRLVVKSENIVNKVCKSKYVGVSPARNNKRRKDGQIKQYWGSRIPKYLSPTNQKIYLGTFTTELRAALAIQFYLGLNEPLVRDRWRLNNE